MSIFFFRASCTYNWRIHHQWLYSELSWLSVMCSKWHTALGIYTHIVNLLGITKHATSFHVRQKWKKSLSIQWPNYSFAYINLYSVDNRLCEQQLVGQEFAKNRVHFVGGIFPLSRPAKSSTWHQQSAHPHRCIETCTARTTLWLLSFLLYTFVFPIYIDFFRKQQPLYCPLQGPSFEMSHCTWLPFPIQSVHIRLGLFFSFFSVSKRYGLINSEHLFAKPLRNDREWFFFMLK